MAYEKLPPLGQANKAGSLPVTLASDEDTLPVSAASLPLPSGASTAANQSTIIGHVDGIETLLGTIDADTSTLAGTDFATQTTLAAINAKLVTGTDIGDVTINNAAGASAVNIQDGGNTITVDGTVTANLSATDNAVLDAIEADTTTIAGAVAGSEMQVDVITMPTVTVTATDLDVQSGGADLATSTQAGAIQTATELIDDAIVADDAAFTPATTKVMMAGFEFDDVTPDSVNEGDAGAARMSANRNIYTTVRDAAGNERGQNVDANGNAGVVLAAETTKVIGTIRAASGGFASGSIASGAIASGAIAAGAIAAGSTSIATTEDTARAAGEHLVKVGVSRLDTPVANANVSGDGDYTNITTDNFGKVWVAGTVPEDTAHVAGEALTVGGVRRIDTAATSAGTSGDWATMDASAEGALWSTLTPTTTSGTSTFMASGSDGSSILVATKQTIKASAGNLYGYYAYNPEAAVTFVHFYNTDTVTVGTTSPQMTIAIPAGSAANLALPYGISFSTAISCAATTTAGGNSAPATGVSLVAWYK